MSIEIYMKLNDGRKSAIFELTFFMAHRTLKPHILFYSNGLAIWHSFPDIIHIKVNNGRKSPFLHLIELIFFRAYPTLKPHILLHSNGQAIWHGLS